MKNIRFALVALLLASYAQARPLLLEEVARLTPPSAEWTYFGRFGVAIDGDFALVSGERWVADPTREEGTRHEGAGLLYLRSGTRWNYVGTLGPVDEIYDDRVTPGLAMKGGVAVVLVGFGARIHERTGTTWTEATSAPSAAVNVKGRDIEIDGGRILVQNIACDQDSRVLRKINGVWEVESQLPGHSFDCDFSPPGIRQDIQGRRLAILNEEGREGEAARIRKWRTGGSGWVEYGGIESAPGTFLGTNLAINGDYTAVNYLRNFGTRLAHESSEGFLRYGLQPADGHMQRDAGSAIAIERANNLFAQVNWGHDDLAYVVNLFRANGDAERTFAHVATLRARDGFSLGALLDASGRRVIVNGRIGSVGDDVVRIFQLPASLETPAVQVQDFDSSGAAALWQPSAGSTFSVVRSGNTSVYRQASTDGNPASWLPGSAASNQSIQAEITPRAFSGADRWVGVATRRVDDANYYYATLRTSGRVELKRMVNGVFTTLSSVPANLVIGRKVRLRLESIGTLHRVYVDDALLNSVTDDALKAGVAGIIMNRAAADYDNVIVSPTPFTTIYADDFLRTGPQEWTFAGGTWQRNGVLRQTSSAGYARIIAGARTDDQVLQVRVRPTSFAGPDYWVGALLRYQDSRNHVYVSLRQRGVISLWRRTNGVVQQLATRAIPVSAGTWYTLRAEVVNGVTRVFVNDQLQLTTTADLGPTEAGVAVPMGSVGLITYNATAEFDDFVAYQP